MISSSVNNHRAVIKCKKCTLPLIRQTMIVSLAALSLTNKCQGNQWIPRPIFPDLVSETSQEPVLAIAGQDVYISCVADNLQNYTILWRYSSDGRSIDDDHPALLAAGTQIITRDPRFTVIQGSHNTWVLKISQVRLTDTGTYICETNSQPRVRVLRLLSVIKSKEIIEPPSSNGNLKNGSTRGWQSLRLATNRHFSQIDYNFTECCKEEYMPPRCQALCQFQQLASFYFDIHIGDECYSQLPSITRCMNGGRNHSDCCERRRIPRQCFPICGQQGDISQMSINDQYACAEYTAPIMACVAEGIDTLPAQPNMVMVEAVSSTKLRVSWQEVTSESELKKLDGWIINLTKLSSFEDSIPRMLRTSSTLSSTSISASSVTSPSSTTSGDKNSPLANLTIVDIMNNSSLEAIVNLLAATSGTISLKLNKKSNEFDIENLKPSTVYQIQMFGYNRLGRSQLTYPIRAVTLSPESDNSASSTNTEQEDIEPQLPDTRKCCQNRGVTLKRCLDSLCDPVEADKATIADLMICAPWSNITFNCLSSNVDHTQCCQRRGVSPFCLSMCSGQVKREDYRHLRCLTHMSTYTNCILESHNVLPSAPQNFTVGPITDSWAVLNWRPSKHSTKSIHGYRIFWRQVVSPATTVDNSQSVTTSTSTPKPPGDTSKQDMMVLLNAVPAEARRGETLSNTSSSDDDGSDEYFYNTAEAATNPYLLDGLKPDTVYETFAVTVNKYGQSEGTARFIFQTLSDAEIIKQRQIGNKLINANDSNQTSDAPIATSGFNETECCIKSGVDSHCRPLCDYDLRMSEVSNPSTDTCSNEMPKVLRCMAANRNSVPCCRNKKVSDECLNVCTGLSDYSVTFRCAVHFAKIIQCMDTASTQIPGAPEDLHAALVTSDKVYLKWKPAQEDFFRDDVVYQVRYQQLANNSNNGNSVTGIEQGSGEGGAVPASLSIPSHPLDYKIILTTNKTEATLDKLKPNTKYSIYATAENSHGISQPSLVLVVDTATSSDDNNGPRATIGPPHSLTYTDWGAKSSSVEWEAPLFVNADANLQYRVYYKEINNANDSNPSAEQVSGSPDGSLVQATSWTVVETRYRRKGLMNLNYPSQYAVAVQAFTERHSGHMSEILLFRTRRINPVIVDQPVVVGDPIEGGNISITCAASGEPPPGITISINGFFALQGTQSPLTYHLVNVTLMFGAHLTISCYAGNGSSRIVKSTTEVSIRFGSKVRAKNKKISSSLQSIARLTCQVAGNPQPMVSWSYDPIGFSSAMPNSKNSLLFGTGGITTSTSANHTATTQLITPNERVSTLIATNYENPFTWTHTLIIKNLTIQDSGRYQCNAKNDLATTGESIELAVQPISLKLLDQSSDISNCCRAQNVSANCLPVCSVDGLDIGTVLKTPDCYSDLDKLMFCGADGRDHRNCCQSKNVPIACLRWCSGIRLSTPTLCFLSTAQDINSCFQEGRALLPGPPQNLRASVPYESKDNHPDISNNGDIIAGERAPNASFESVISNNELRHALTPTRNSNDSSSEPTTSSSNPTLASDSTVSSLAKPLLIEWDPPTTNPSLVLFYRVFWRTMGTMTVYRITTNKTWVTLNALDPNKMHFFAVKAGNLHGTSVYSDPLRVTPSEVIDQAAKTDMFSPWFLVSSNGAPSAVGRVLIAVCSATLIMFGSVALVFFLEKKGYLRRFATSKSNSARVSHTNPTYMKEFGDGNGDMAIVPVVDGTSLEVLDSNSSSSTDLM